MNSLNLLPIFTVAMNEKKIRIFFNKKKKRKILGDVEGKRTLKDRSRSAIDALLCTWITQFRDGASSSGGHPHQATSANNPLDEDLRAEFYRARLAFFARYIYVCSPWNFLNVVILPFYFTPRRFLKDRKSWTESEVLNATGDVHKFLKGATFVTDTLRGT